MKVLVIALSAPPKNSPESVQTGRYLQHLAKSMEVTLLTTKIYGGWEPADQSLEKYLQSVFRVLSVRLPHPKLISLVRRIWPSLVFPDEGFFFLLQQWWIERKIGHRPDLIISRSAPFSSAIMARRMSSKWGIPWIMHLSDPWAGNPYEQNNGSTHKRAAIAERDCMRVASAITVTSKKTVAYYQTKYPVWREKFHFLPNVFDDQSQTGGVLEFDKPMKFVFTGRLYGDRNLFLVIEAIEEACRKHPVCSTAEFLFAGFFDDRNAQRIQNTPAKNIKWLGPLSSEQANKLQHEAAVLISIDGLADNPMFDLYFPSKLLDYFLVQRPIIAITNTTSTTYHEVEGKFGRCFNSRNQQELPDYIAHLVEQYRSKNKLAFKVSNEFGSYSSRVQSEVLIALANKIVAHG